MPWQSRTWACDGILEMKGQIEFPGGPICADHQLHRHSSKRDALGTLVAQLRQRHVGLCGNVGAEPFEIADVRREAHSAAMASAVSALKACARTMDDILEADPRGLVRYNETGPVTAQVVNRY